MQVCCCSRSSELCECIVPPMLTLFPSLELRVILTSYYKAVQGWLATDRIILNQCQEMRTTSELAPSYPSFHITPTGGILSLDSFDMPRPFLHGGSSVALGLNSCPTSHESVLWSTI
ncbi:hypothetical protein TNCV_4150751 [Trichonephila clavipes]|nr:hypothetical protein TNCV_4150751 [Trichonephila clavipes]